MKFNYQAKIEEGGVQTGVIEAATKEAAVSILQNYGLFVTLLEEESSRKLFSRKIKIFKGVSHKDIVAFSRQLSIMFKSNITLLESLRILGSQSKNQEIKERVSKIIDDVEGGISFSKALERHPKIFSSFFVNMVRSGESSGKLSESLEYLADHLEREHYLQSKIKGAMLYPIFILGVMLIISVIMIIFVFPTLEDLFADMDQELPMLTKLMLGSVAFARKWGILTFLGVMAMIGFLFQYRKSESGKRKFDKLLLKIPLISNFLKMLYISRFAENLSTLIGGGLAISQALEISGRTIGNVVYQDIIFNARDEVRKGEQISSILQKHPDLFPPIFTQMAMVGEKTGTLDTTLLNVVRFYKREVDQGIDSLLSLLEPILIVVMGVVVSIVVAAVLTPMYDMVGSM